MRENAYALGGIKLLVTGAGRGMGAEIARLASQCGAQVIVTDVDRQSVESVTDELVASGGTATYVECDLSEADAIRDLVGVAAQAFGGIDAIVNNAGVSDAMVRSSPRLSDLDEADWDRIHAINTRSIVLLAKHALPHLTQSKNASITNVASIAALVAHPNTIAYGTSKAAVLGLTRNLAVELAPHEVRVNCYCPGVVETEMFAEYIATKDDPEAFRQRLVDENLMPRLGQPREMAHIACFLASPGASFVNGAVWVADGGNTAWRGVRDW